MSAWHLVFLQAAHFTAWPSRRLPLSQAAQAPAPAKKCTVCATQ